MISPYERGLRMFRRIGTGEACLAQPSRIVCNLSKRDADGHPYFVVAEFANKVVLAVQQYLSVLEAFDPMFLSLQP
jgi:hypothetical protein